MAQPRVVEAGREDEPVLVKEGVAVAEYLARPESTTAHNLIEGRLYMSPTPIFQHQKLVGLIFRALDDFARTNGGEAFVSPMDCHLPDGSVLQPDVGYVSAERAGIIERWVMGAPDLVVEVLSPGTRRFDRVEKLRAYEKNGVREAWLVDPDSQTVIVFTAEENAWRKEQSALFGDPIPSTLAPLGSAGLEQFA
ncbi:MAG: Uma2 family endonuclease [Chloroflexi bacterium]|nr:Uma2 family endonuclease [Chloroflexota bacterium]PWB41832.1 MAG: restriction endonuclease [Dehalococcoidia bacterium]